MGQSYYCLHVEKGNGMGRQPEMKMVLVAVVVIIVVNFQVVVVSVMNFVGFAKSFAKVDTITL